MVENENKLSGDSSKCLVLVPVAAHIEPACEAALAELARGGYTVRRVYGYAAIDQARNDMATDALADGFEETMWIDADISFDPAAVDQLRAAQLPIVCGIYARKGRRALACHALPGTKRLVFGVGGGLLELRYAGTGFLLVRRQVYVDLQERLGLPVCNQRFGRATIPFFQPMVIEDREEVSDEGGENIPLSPLVSPHPHWYLPEDFAFCERARQCGYKIMADATIRLRHHGSYGYSWEDAGIDRTRYDTFYYDVE
ncbi:MAG: hypothetical protein WD894_02965 [Pirellulales bacterium]